MPIAVWIFVILVGVLFALKMTHVIATGLAVSTTGGALFTSTSPDRIHTSLDAVPMKPGDLLIDLGCGDGRVLIHARKRYGVKAVGFEVNLWAYVLAMFRTARVAGIEVIRASFWNYHTGGAAVIFCYLFPDVMERLARKLENELRPGTKVISMNFPIPGWTPDMVIRAPSGRSGDPTFVYQVPGAFSQ